MSACRRGTAASMKRRQIVILHCLTRRLLSCCSNVVQPRSLMGVASAPWKCCQCSCCHKEGEGAYHTHPCASMQSFFALPFARLWLRVGDRRLGQSCSGAIHTSPHRVRRKFTTKEMLRLSIDTVKEDTHAHLTFVAMISNSLPQWINF